METDKTDAKETTAEETATVKKVQRNDDEELFDTVFLRNVSRFDTTQETLKAHMEENFGETVYCLICKDKETSESKGTAFVKFKDPETAGNCLGDFEDREMQHKFFLDGRNIFVLPALNRNQIGEVKRASAKKDDAPVVKKFKKARHHRINKEETKKLPSVKNSKKKKKKRSTTAGRTMGQID